MFWISIIWLTLFVGGKCTFLAILGHFLAFFGYLMGHPNQICPKNPETLFLRFNLTTHITYLSSFFTYVVNTIFVLFFHFPLILGYVSVIWLATLTLKCTQFCYILFEMMINSPGHRKEGFQLGFFGFPCGCGEKCHFWPFWAIFDPYWGTWWVTRIRYGPKTLKHCL